MSEAELERKRESAMEVLTQAYSRDVLSVEEYEARVAEVQATLDSARLDEIAAETLPALRGATAYAGTEYLTPAFPGARTTQAIARGSLQDLTCVMGEKVMRGNWLVAENVNAMTVMGETVVDLRECVFPERPLQILAKTIMGETKFIVPQGVSVRFDVKVILGEGVVARGVSQTQEPGRPHIVISGICVMGEIVVASA